MRYEMRMLDNGWAVWDTETNAPASVEMDRKAKNTPPVKRPSPYATTFG
jgi:hypothetical protein